MKRDKYDTVVSDLVRWRDNWKCCRCGIVSNDGQITGKDRNMHCSHFTSRGAGNIPRYDTDAISTHCATCHRYLEDRPDEHTKWFIEKHGEAFLDIIREKHNQTCKMTKDEKEEMYLHYRKELTRIKGLRMDGKQGVLKVTSYF